VPRRVPGRVMPCPVRESGSIAEGFKRADAAAEIDGLDVDESGHHRQKTADPRILRRIFRAAREIWKFERMREDGHVPQIGKLQRAAGMIHVAVR